jgi:pyruvate dehydrogenase E2 component (dihydrolipoamide acetyltransferase)
VPVIHDAHTRSVDEIAREAARLVEAARAERSGPADLQGATFTITNLGMYDIDAFTPVVALPQSAILGVGRIVARPVVVDDSVAVRQMLWLSLTFDHRVVDGAPAARFLQAVKNLVERPTRWIFR